ncbi:MAG: DNA-deoxyinosine glycosylase [Bacteroidales bacterium]|nr:DNA-deoxyinosine glycosylase [Bacteroidales bacterium]
MPFGLPAETIRNITGIIAANPSVEKIVLFGSRAKGNAVPGSDIDLAVTGTSLVLNDFLDFSLQVDRLEIPQKADIIDYRKISDDALIDHIKRVGIVLYENGLYRSYGLSPVADERSEFLILGTFPSEMSLQQQKYYANPKNQFWQILLSVMKEPFTDDYGRRLALLKKHRIALWDIVESCIRKGSGDSGITDETANDPAKLIETYPNLRYMIFNGNRSLQYFAKHERNEDPLVMVPSFPSTSSRYTRLTLAEKTERWKVMRFIPGFR